MKVFLTWQCLVLMLILEGCRTPEMVQGPDGSWYETGQKITFPQVQVKVIRDEKDIRFPEKLQIQLIAYREKMGIWPYSIDGFIQESKENQAIFHKLHQNGYSDLLFINQADTLLIYFKFAYQRMIRSNKFDESDLITKLIPGVWKYYPKENGKFGFEQDLYVDY